MGKKGDLDEASSKQIQLRRDLMNAKSEEDYDSNLKDLVKCNTMAFFKEFLRSWDSYKKLWVRCEMSEVAATACENHSKVKLTFSDSLHKSTNSSSFPFESIINFLIKDRFVHGHSSGGNTSVFSHHVSAAQAYQDICLPKV